MFQTYHDDLYINQKTSLISHWKYTIIYYSLCIKICLKYIEKQSYRGVISVFVYIIKGNYFNKFVIFHLKMELLTIK